ncbi:MAG: DUF1501 domain-containing protein [Isosphaeraceae bacterium]
MSHHTPRPDQGSLTRRELLTRSGMGFGALALGGILADQGLLTNTAKGAVDSISPLAPRLPQFAPKAKRVIHLFMNGGPSQVDTFDPKPALTKFSGKPMPSTNLATERKTGAALGSPFSFKKYGQSGIEVSDIFPHVGECIDDICVIRSMQADVPNHEPSLMLMNCGDARQARPSVGSWALYGLGTENQNLPGFMVMCPGGYPIAESQNWQAGFLPGVYQGTYLDTQNTDIEKLIQNIKNNYVSNKSQREQLDLLLELNRDHIERRGQEAELEARIQSFELAYRMQSEAGDAFDVSREPEHIREMYGPGVHARQLLIARRLLERGVRYIQVWHGQGQPWDNHVNIEPEHRKLAKQCDQGIGALLKDLKQRGMLEDTLVIWGGEFGRTPSVELPMPGTGVKAPTGRDHNHYGFSMWLAGGGVKGGHVHGATDDFGFQAVEGKVHVHDLHATILHLLGFNHETFTYRYAGRDFRLTDVHGRVVSEILA